LQVDDEIEFSRLQNWKIGWFLTFENSGDVGAHLSIRISDTWSVTDQSALVGIFPKLINGGQPILRGERDDATPASIEIWVGRDQQRTDPRSRQRRKGRIQFAIVTGLDHQELSAKFWRS